MKNDKGFSLIEVIASIVILSIVLLSFFQIFIQTNKTAVSNNERLVVINLANAQLERLKLEPFADGILDRPGTGSYNKTIQLAEDKRPVVNGRPYPVEIHASQDTDEKAIKLIKVKVTVTAEKGKSKSSVEGYVSYE